MDIKSKAKFSLDDTFAAFFGNMEKIEAEVKEAGFSDSAMISRNPQAANAADTTEEAARNRS